MNAEDRICWILTGIIFAVIGIIILSMDSPVIGKYGGPGFPTYHWLGWGLIPYGFFLSVTNLRGYFTDRKKRRANIARYRAEREAEEASREDKPQS